MSQTPPRRVNRVPQFMLLGAAAALIVFLILLGTDTITLDSAPIMMISSALFGIAMIATALEFGLNQTGLEKSTKKNEE